MATKLQYITALHDEALYEMPQSAESWAAFLHTAAFNYKYRFHDQVSIHSQRPDATACASMDVWNKRLDRWINRGAKGIALINTSNTPSTLSYVFDVSDTHGRAVSLWSIKPEYEAEVCESLRNSYGEFEAGSFTDSVRAAVANAVEDNYADYFDKLFLWGMVNEGERDDFKAIISESVAFMVLTRCGIEAPITANLGKVANFKDKEVLAQIGAAVSDISETMLRDIEATVRNLQKSEKSHRHTFAKIGEWVQNITVDRRNHNDETERSDENGTDNLHRGQGRDSLPRPDVAGGAERAGSIRNEEKGISSESSQRDILPVGARREIGQSSGRGGADSIGYDGEADRTDGSDRGRDRSAESRKSDGVDQANEQHPSSSRGDSQHRDNLQLGLFEAGSDELPASFVSARSAPLGISQQIVDEILCDGGNKRNSTLRICSRFSRLLTPQENVDFLKQEYRKGGKGFVIDGQNIAVWWDENGIRIAQGKSASNAGSVLITWEQAEKRINELLALGRYISPDDLEKASENEFRETAEMLWYIYRDELGGLPEEWNGHKGFAEDVDVIVSHLRQPDKLKAVAEQYQIDSEAFLAAPTRRIWHDLRKMQRDLQILQIEPAVLPATRTPTLHQRFITTDEVDASLISRGSGVSEGKFRIYEFFREHTGTKERADFLRNEFGIGGSTHALSGADDSHVWHDSKGLAFSRGMIGAPYDKVLLKWDYVAKRIADLIATDRYLSDSEKAHLPAYRAKIEELRQAREEERIARELAENTPKPSKADAIYELPLGTTIYLGTKEYTLHSISDDIVELRAEDFPLFPEEFERSRFERMLRENPQNDHLIVGYGEQPQIAEEPESVQITEEAPTANNDDLIGAELTIDDRKFVVESVTESTAELRDVTFQQSTGFPVFRVEPIENVRKHLQPKEEIKLREIVIDLTARDPYDVPSVEETALTPQWERRTESSSSSQMSGEKHNFRITDENLGHGGPKAKYTANVAAIRLLKQLEEESRLATHEEQEVLSRYVGWGGISQAFDENNQQWANEYRELRDLLTDEEYTSARGSVLNAFYTSPVVIKAMYEALGNMGFSAGNILEPSCGVGNFMGLLPESMNGSKMYGVELDSITGRIARQLYQDNDIRIQGFEQSDFPDSFFDVAIGNVPFGDYKLPDRRYDRNNFLIHDYFFAKALDKVRPGGIVAFVTSMGTMDKQNSSVRRYIAQRADLIGAIRLPNNAFQANAGTGVTSDIIFLQKRDRIIEAEPDWVHLATDSNGITLNSYFAENPDMILGEMTTESTQYGRQEAVCKPIEGADLAEQLRDAIANIHAQITEYEVDEPEEKIDASIPADPTVKNFSYTVVDGKIYFRENSRMNPVELSVTAQNRIKGMIGLRDCVRKLIEYQTEDHPEAVIQRQQTELNRLYDDFTKKYGLINSRANSSAFCADSSYSILSSLEIINEDGQLERKADIFTKRTIRPRQIISSVDTASEALAVSLCERAKVDVPFMAELTHKSEEEIVRELSGVIFRLPDSDEPQYVTADEYLSGNVREKLKAAITAAESNPEYSVNVRALEAVQPKDLSASEIAVRLGATWVPPEIVQQFMFELLATPRYNQWKMKVHFSPITAQWFIENKSFDRGNFHANSTYGTHRINAYAIIEETLNLRDVKIFDTKEDEYGNKIRVLNKKETAIAQGKQDLIRQKFIDWIWADPNRRERLVRMYNDRFNSVRPREYDGTHLLFPGMNPEITLRPHQVNAVAHILYGGNTLLAHSVGAGKTFTMAAAAMESRRLGLANKPMFVVPNHLTEQWASEFLQLYPSANILVATKKDFEARNRRKFCARIATGDYDAVIIGHSQFEKIPISAERQERFIQEQIDELTDGIAEIKRQHGERFTIKQMERARKQLVARLTKMHDQSRKDDVVTFEELGVDRIFVDEAHSFKNLAVVTKMTRVAGISQTEAMKSSDLYAKCRYLDELTDGRGVIFATGTPISNSMTEMYTMQRYLQYETLRRNGLSHFDAWASTFGECVTAIELSPEGTGYRAKTRFSRFYNLPELMSMFREVADVQTADMLKLNVPTAHFHNVSVKPSEQQERMVAELSERADRVRNGMVDSTVDNMLKITNDGRKLALDQRLINPLLPDDPNSKVNACIQTVYETWERTTPNRSAQLVFCDLSTPKADGSFSVYTDIRDKLIAQGVPPEEIAFIHDADTDAKKKELFSKVRKGQVRVLIGSTAKMGAGTNVQKRLAAIHHLDCPWRPADLEQRNGRLIRQGNDNSDVDVYTYVTERTFDAYLFQLVENKQKFIGQVMTSKSPARSAEDVDEQALSYAEIKALATGNPLIKEKMDLDVAVARLTLLRASYLSQKYALEDRILKEFPQTIARLEQRIEGFKADMATAVANPSDKDSFSPMMIQGVHYAEKAAAGEALIKTCKAMTSPEPIKIGSYRGFALELSFDSFSRNYILTLVGTLRHSVELGTDVFGNLTRIDNVLEGFEKRMHSCEEQLANTRGQLADAQVEVKKPFPQEQELQEKTARLNELNSLLNMDEKESVLIDGEPDEGEENAPPQRHGEAR